jgi:hypothetical protein
VRRRPPGARLPCRLPPNATWPAAAGCVGGPAADAGGPARPVVAVLIPVSARGQGWRGAGESHLLARSLPSLLRHAEAGFEYRFYVGHDADDGFFGGEAVRRDLAAWLRRELGRGQGAALLAFANELRKPGPVFNFLSAAAAADGADYIYRINDDTRATAPYAAAMVAARYRIPYNTTHVRLKLYCVVYYIIDAAAGMVAAPRATSATICGPRSRVRRRSRSCIWGQISRQSDWIDSD